MQTEISIMVMSGVDDGSIMRRNRAQGDGTNSPHGWMLTIGRHDNNDICLNNDTFVSRHHAQLYIDKNDFRLADNHSTNGTYIENADGEDMQVHTLTPLRAGQLFRIGRTWLRIEQYE